MRYGYSSNVLVQTLACSLATAQKVVDGYLGEQTYRSVRKSSSTENKALAAGAR